MYGSSSFKKLAFCTSIHNRVHFHLKNLTLHKYIAAKSTDILKYTEVHLNLALITSSMILILRVLFVDAAWLHEILEGKYYKYCNCQPNFISECSRNGTL